MTHWSRVTTEANRLSLEVGVTLGYPEHGSKNVVESPRPGKAVA
jgi:hypothetical protein